MDYNIFDLKRIDKAARLSLVKKTLRNYPILEEIYDAKFIDNLANRPHSGNYLLWLLVSKNAYTELTWKSICNNLEALRDCNSIAKFKDKLKAKEETVFKNYQTELEFAGHYKKLGYQVELEPIDGVDFSVKTADLDVFFQMKHIYLEEDTKKKGIQIRLHERLERVEESFVFNLKFIGKVKEEESKPIEQHIKTTLKQLSTKEVTFPFIFHYPDEKNPTIEVTVWRRSPRSYGYLRRSLETMSYSANRNSKNVRKKITKKILKLPKETTNVIIIGTTIFPINAETIEDTLLGDSVVRINTEDFSISEFRKRNGIFSLRKNRRVSAAIYYRRTFRDEKFVDEKIVYHHPLPYKAIPFEFFVEEGVKQLVPVEKETEILMEWIEGLGSK